MDLALAYNPQLQAYDLVIAGTDLLGDESLASSALVSLMCDRLAADYEVKPGEDRRGWWADVFAADGHLTGSRLWLLNREKQLQSVVNRCKSFCEEAMQWFIEDGLAQEVAVTVFVPRQGWLVAMIKFVIKGKARTLRFEFDQTQQRWQLAGEAF